MITRNPKIVLGFRHYNVISFNGNSKKGFRPVIYTNDITYLYLKDSYLLTKYQIDTIRVYSYDDSPVNNSYPVNIRRGHLYPFYKNDIISLTIEPNIFEMFSSRDTDSQELGLCLIDELFKEKTGFNRDEILKTLMNENN